MPILLVEDDPDVAEYLSEILLDEGHVIKHVADGNEALAEIAKTHYELILADYKMPNLNGIELLNELNQIGNLAPVVLITGFGDKGLIKEALRKGAFDFLEKPILESEFKHQIAKALNFGRALAALQDAFFALDEFGLADKEKRQALTKLLSLLGECQDI